MGRQAGGPGCRRHHRSRCRKGGAKGGQGGRKEDQGREAGRRQKVLISRNLKRKCEFVGGQPQGWPLSFFLVEESHVFVAGLRPGGAGRQYKLETRNSKLEGSVRGRSGRNSNFCLRRFSSLSIVWSFLRVSNFKFRTSLPPPRAGLPMSPQSCPRR